MLRERVLARVREHLSRDEWGKQAAARIAVLFDEISVEFGTWTVRASISGTFNGQPINASTKAVRSVHRARPPGLFPALIAGLASIALNAVTATKDRDFKRIAECIDDCVAQLCLAMDKQAGRPMSSQAHLFDRVQRARWLAPALAVCYWLGLIVVFRPITPAIVMAAFMATIAGGFGFLFLHVINLVWVPSTFFTDDARGRLAMSRSGVSSVLALRVVVLLLAIGLGAFCVLFVRGAHDFVIEKPKQTDKKAR